MGTPANPPPGLDPAARQLIQQVAAELADLRREVRAGQRGQRQAQLGHATVDDGAIRFTSASGGVLTAGKQPDGTVAVAAANGPPPPAPSMPQVFPAIGGLSVAWDGLAAASGGVDAMPADFDHVDVHVSTTDGFTPDASTKLGTLSRAGSIALTPLDAVEQYVRLVAVSTSGTVSDPSATASGTPLEAPAGGGGDTIPPAAPVLSSTIPVAAYIDPSGDARSTATVSWMAPTTNADGTPLHDGSYVEVQYRPTAPAGAAWASVAAAWTDTSVTIVELTPGSEYEFQARAVDTSGNASEWTAPVTQTMAVDTDAPATPSAPTVAASLTAVQVTHHLTDNTGHALDDDLDHLDVHIGTATDFTPGASTKAGSLIATKGMIDASLYAVGTFQVTQTIVCYVKVIAVDRSGNASPPSLAASTTALLIDSAHISDLTASKITAGELGADVVVGARIKTADSGARVELNAAGIQAFDAAGNETLTVADADGSVSLIGEIASGPDGSDRVRVNPAGADYPEIRFESADDPGNYAGIRSAPSAADNQATMRIDSGLTPDGTAYTAHFQSAQYIHLGLFSPATDDGTPYQGGHVYLDDTGVKLHAYDATGAFLAGLIVTSGGIQDATYTDWYPLTMNSGWVNNSGVTSRAKKHPDGTVTIQGELKPGSSPSAFNNGLTIALLPYLALAPTQNVTLPVTLGSGKPYGPPPCIVISPSGWVVAWYCGTTNATTAPPVIQFCGTYGLGA